ncbi:hypothetical protein BDB01DRAFT_784220 [Pilobolus umbonatus]|nr:hypothetical protein BDB01DRAFT_784220 [Pilobolus umbonatus]
MDDNMPNITSISTQSHPIDCTHLPSTHSIQSAADIYPVNSTNNKTDIDILYEQIEDLTHERIEEPDLVNDLLVTYMTDNDDNALLQEHQSQIHALQQQLIECEQTTQQRMLYYVGELEKERLETKRLRSVLCKQDELISVIEKKLFGFIATSHSNDQELLQAQLDLQCIELEDHKKLVTILEIEKDGLLRQLQYIRKKRGLDDNEHPTYFYSHTQRSSIDLLADLAQSDLLLTHTHPSPPPSPPPSNPLPPLPTPQYSMPTPSSTNQTTPIPKSWSLLSFPNNKKASIIRRASKRISTAISHKEDVPLSSSTSTSSLSTLTKKLHLKYWK